MKKPKMEFSKKIFYLVMIIVVVVIIYSMALMWKTNDTTALAYLIPAVMGEMGVATGFYYNKAKAENKLKLSKRYNVDYIPDEESEESEE